MARKYFGNADPIDEVIFLDEKAYTVTGVVDNVPQNSHWKYDGIMTALSAGWRANNSSWGANVAYTYLTTSNNAEIESLEAKFEDIIKENLFKSEKEYLDFIQDGNFYGYELQSLGSIHF